MRAEKFFGCLPGTLVVALTLGACHMGPPQRVVPGSGGASGSGGAAPAGGSLGTGGWAASGGASGTGGLTGTGGRAGSGGASGTGGLTGSGGTSLVGGAGGDGGAAGGSTGTGGQDATGGSTGSGGRTGAGGGMPTGGTGSGGACALTSGLAWSSTASLMDPVSDGSHNLVAIESPTTLLDKGQYALYATVVDTSGNATMTYSSFSSFAQAGRSPVYYLDNVTGFSGSHYAPQLFYFTPQSRWYLISQSSGPAYSTATDPTQPQTWSKPTSFFSTTPSIVSQNAGSAGITWTDFWVICDSANCYLFFTNQNGYVFRSQTSRGSFPNGFGTPVVVMQSSDGNSLYGGVSVYAVKGTGKFLLLVDAVGATGHYLRSWTASSLAGSWTALADSESTPFAGAQNVSFSGTAWTKDIGNGEILRESPDETMTVTPCNMQYVYQGKDPYSSATGNAIAWKLGLLTQTN